MSAEREGDLVYDIQRIMEFLPHRYPMLLVDRVMDVEAGKRCKGLKNVTINESFFLGHYPGHPVMPGVLILEAMAQAGAVLLLTNPDNVGKTPLIGAINSARFRRPVVPGDQLIMDVELAWTKASYGCLRGTATVDGEVAAEMEITFKLESKERP